MYMTFYRPVLGKVSFFFVLGVGLPKIGLADGERGRGWGAGWSAVASS